MSFVMRNFDCNSHVGWLGEIAGVDRHSWTPWHLHVLGFGGSLVT